MKAFILGALALLYAVCTLALVYAEFDVFLSDGYYSDMLGIPTTTFVKVTMGLLLFLSFCAMCAYRTSSNDEKQG